MRALVSLPIFICIMLHAESANAAPVAIAAISAAVSTAAAGAFSAAAFFSAFAKSLVLGQLSKMLSPKPKNRGAGNSAIGGTTVAVRQSDSSRKYVYGQIRIADVYAHATTVGTDNKYLYLIIILCNNEVEDIGEVWADDYCIPPDWLDSNGKVTTGRYKDKLWIRKHLGAPTQTADAMMVAEVPSWTATDRLQGIAYLVVKMEYDRDKYPNGEPNFSAIVKGKKLYDPRTGSEKFSANTVLFTSDYLKGEHGLELTADEIDDDNTAVEASIADEIVATADKDMTVGFNSNTELPTTGSPAPNAVDVSTNIIALKGDRLLFELGDRVRVISTDSPSGIPGGLSAGTDYYVIPYQFKTNPRIKLAASLSDAMAGAAIDITSTGSGTITIRKTGEPRYHGAAVLDTADTIEDNLEKLRLGYAGRIPYIGGKYNILTAAWRTPEVTFNQNDLLSSIIVRTQVSTSDAFNVMRGLYVSSINDYQSTDYPEVRNQTFIDEDLGREEPRTVHRPCTNRSDTAQRLGAIDLKRERQTHSATITTTLKALRVKPGGVIALDFDHWGYSGKYFEVVSQSFTVVGGQNPQVAIKMDIRETAEGVYTWSLEDAAAVDPAPNSALPSAFNVEAPTGLSFSSIIVDTRDGDAIYQMVASWNEHPNQFVLQRGMFELEYKLSSDSEYQATSPIDGSQTSAIVIQGTSVGVAYDFRVRAVNNLGVRSSFSYIFNAVVGSSGGVGTTANWQTYQDTVGSSNDWQSFQDTVGSSSDWGFYT